MSIITTMNYERIDLNLLVVFDAVMTELSVTRAAEQLCMTQPAVSNALKRLRRILNDELFIKVPSGVSPTPKAVEIWLPIRDALAQIRQTLQPLSFEPAKSTLTFTFVVTDYIATSTVSLILPIMLRRLEQSAPNINLRFFPTTNANASVLLERGEADMALGVFPNPGTRFRTYTLLTEQYECVMRSDHPLANSKLTLKKFIGAKHLMVSMTGEPIDFVDRLLEEKGLKRRIALRIAQFALAPVCILNSDLIGTLASRVVRNSEQKDKLYVTPLPIEVEPKAIRVMWHERNQQNPAHNWLRSLLIELCGSI
jgi:DNA-binding transcriptional LysR family regulator